jgi:hypothetical protein
MDIMPAGYCVKNCTNDTLFVDLTDSDTLTDNFYWGVHPDDTVGVFQKDTTSVYIRGKKVILYKFHCVLPDSTSWGFYPLPKETCYIYIVKKQVITRYTFDEICEKKLYDRKIVTKKSFHDNVFEYRP